MSLLNEAALTGSFGYHPQCQAVQLTNLSFTDDILVFNDGTVSSLQGVMEVMGRFAGMSGLHINVVKSSIFPSGRGMHDLCEEATKLRIRVGSLPIRYLGLPLTTKRLTKKDYEPLIDKIRNHMLSWTNKSLSFAGRFQVTKLSNLSYYKLWSQAFILPKGSLDEIESPCSAFL